MDSSSASEPSGFASLTVSLIVVCVLFPMLATLAVGLRFFTRRKFSISVKADDWIILPALFVAIMLCVACIIGAVRGGVGGPSVALTPDEATILAKITYAVAIVYPSALPIIKFSILLFYKRLFQDRYFLILQYCIGIFILICWISEEFATIFQCTPIAANWTAEGSCIAEAAMYDILSAANVFSDVFILVMPWPIILKLQVRKQKKIQLLGIFLLGSFTCLAGTMSFVYVVLDGHPSTHANLSHFTGYLYIWFCIETNIGIICACLPAISPLWIRPYRLSRSLTSLKSHLRTSIPLNRPDESTSRTSSHSTFIFRANSNAGLMSEDAGGKQGDKSDSPVDVGDQVPRDVEAQWRRQEFSGCTAVSKDGTVYEADRFPFEQIDFANKETEVLEGPQELAASIQVPEKARGHEVHEMPAIVEVPLVVREEALGTLQELGDSSAVSEDVGVYEVQGSEVAERE
ncbi:hypothetical protein MMC17_005911 [Xylographa soralifera]|nr:hypothetical protein [Xylographa soralifera]